MTQSFHGRQKYASTSDQGRAQDSKARSNSNWSARQSKKALAAAAAKAEAEGAELKSVQEARRELPHLLDRAIHI